MADKYQNKYRIPSARLSLWDYSSSAAYFITVCTANREHYFGEIIDDKMQLSEIGKKANNNWLDISNHFSFVILDEFIVMPNHIHGIIVINKPGNIIAVNVDNASDNVAQNDGSNIVTNDRPNISPNVRTVSSDGNGVETGHALSLQRPSFQSDQSSDNQSQQLNQPSQPDQIKTKPHPRFRNQGKNSISAMIGSFKSAVTKCCNENKLPFGWQSRFHDHIIRDNNEFIRIRDYIINNPMNWKEDKFYKP